MKRARAQLCMGVRETVCGGLLWVVVRGCGPPPPPPPQQQQQQQTASIASLLLSSHSWGGLGVTAASGVLKSGKQHTVI